MAIILIVDDHAIVRQGMRSLLSSTHADWEIIEAENGVQAIIVASRIIPDLILMDHLMPRLDGIKASKVITQTLPESTIVMITMTNPKDLSQGAKEAGVRDIIPKEKSIEDIVATISEIVDEIKRMRKNKKEESKCNDNKKVFSGKKITRYGSSMILSDREFQVIELIMKGFTIIDISNYLSISKRTVETHKYKVMKRFDLHSSNEMIRFFTINKISPPQ